MTIKQTTGHRIKSNDCSYLPNYIVCFDTETNRCDDRGRHNEYSHRLRLWTAKSARLIRGKYGAVRCYSGTAADQFWDAIARAARPNYTLWLVAHSALFDCITLGLPAEIESGRWVLDKPRSKRNCDIAGEESVTSKTLCVIDAPPVIIGLRHVLNKSRIVIVDTLNWFRTPLAEIGNSAGLEKLPMPEQSAPDSDWLEYCQRDTDIVFAAFTELASWVRKQNFGMFRYTASGQAMSAYRHRFMSHDILVHDNEQAKQLERRAYFGARTEVFRKGTIDCDCWQYDINALFPYAMSHYQMPWRLAESDIASEYRSADCISGGVGYVAECEIETEFALYPMRIQSYVVYPTGCFRTSLCGVELQRAIERGHVKAVKSWCRYDCTDLFSNWVSTLYAMRIAYRQDGNFLYERFVKSLLNSLYGKFGQLSPEWEYCPGDLSAVPWSTWQSIDSQIGKVTTYRSFGYDVFRKVDKSEIGSTFVAIAAFVTAAARDHVDAIRKQLPPRSCLYQGCDAFIVTREGHERIEQLGLIHPDKLGCLKLECFGNFGNIFGCHDYTLGNKTVIAGRAGKLTESGCQQIMQHRFSKTADLFNGVAQEAVVERLVQWQRTQNYCKGDVQNDGWVQPFDVNGDSSVGSSISGS